MKGRPSSASRTHSRQLFAPYVMHPRQMRDTFTPVMPRRTYSIFPPSPPRPSPGKRSLVLRFTNTVAFERRCIRSSVVALLAVLLRVRLSRAPRRRGASTLSVRHRIYEAEYLAVPDQRDDEFRVRPRFDGHRLHPVHTERFVHEAQPVLPHGKRKRRDRGHPEVPIPLVDLRPGNRLDHFQRPHQALQPHPETRKLRQRIGGYASRDVSFLAENDFPSRQRGGVQGEGCGTEVGPVPGIDRDAFRVRLDPHPFPLPGPFGISWMRSRGSPPGDRESTRLNSSHAY